ncbi:unnamed protein product [Rhodiola kirilowii]
MAFWWPFLVWTDDGKETKENSYIYIPPRGRQSDKVQCYEPATMKYLGFFPALTPAEEHVAHARKAQKIWALSTFKQRRQFVRILLKYIIEPSRSHLRDFIPRYWKDNGEKWLKPEYRSSGRSMIHKSSRVEFHPLGVVAALAAVGAPENLVNVITGDFAETGRSACSSVDKIIFVGSPGVGKMIICFSCCTNCCKSLHFNPVVSNCAGAERFYVHQGIYSAFVGEVAKIVKSVTAGHPLAGKFDMGAICGDAVDQFFPPYCHCKCEPHNEIDAGRESQLYGYRFLDPILPIMKFSSDEEVIKLANDSRYGLGCAVFSGSQRRARKIASKLHCGVAAINDFASNYMCQSLPFGGVKDSGFGRFAGVEGLRACCVVKSVVEDRWWPLVKTKIPKPIQYPVAENGFEFQKHLVETLYGLNIWDRLRSLVDLLKILTEHNSSTNQKQRVD